MTDKKLAKSEENNTTTNDKKNVSVDKPQATLDPSEHKAQSDTAKAGVDASTLNKEKIMSKPVTPSKATAQKPSSTKATPQRASSKTGAIALVLSICSLIAIGGHYYWQTKQHSLLVEQLLSKSQAQQKSNESNLLALINQQQDVLASDMLTKVEHALGDKENQLNAITQQLNAFNLQLDELGKNQPTNWPLIEAEYLIRIAARSLWLEKNTAVAVNLLSDANARLKELNDPALLPIRAVINQDIEMLNLQPELAIDDVILKIMGLAEQVNRLPIAMAYLPESTEKQTQFELSTNTGDWQENLSKSWHKFMENFITVRRRTANVEALLSPQQQQNLRQNLHLKLQRSQWAASQHESTLYIKSLDDAANWVGQYFDDQDEAVQRFITQITQLKSEVISLSLPRNLQSLALIREHIRLEKTNRSVEPLPVDPTPSSNDEALTPATSPSDNAQEDNNEAVL